MECERGIRFPRHRSFHLVSCRQMAAFRGELSGPARIHAQEERAFARLAEPDANSGQPVDKPGRIQEELQLTADERVEAVSVRNLPSNRVFEVGWLRRVATYRRPIADPESSPQRALRKSLRVTAAQ